MKSEKLINIWKIIITQSMELFNNLTAQYLTNIETRIKVRECWTLYYKICNSIISSGDGLPDNSVRVYIIILWSRTIIIICMYEWIRFDVEFNVIYQLIVYTLVKNSISPSGILTHRYMTVDTCAKKKND